MAQATAAQMALAQTTPAQTVPSSNDAYSIASQLAHTYGARTPSASISTTIRRQERLIHKVRVVGRDYILQTQSRFSVVISWEAFGISVVAELGRQGSFHEIKTEIAGNRI